MLTSNRDEKIQRSIATPPEFQSFPSGRMLFPRDGDAGGSWIVVHQNGATMVLLNGAFQPHVPDPPYDRSRGKVLLDLADDNDPVERFRNIRLDRIEPFTAIIFAMGSLHECRWDGHRKHITIPDKAKPHIWSSVTIYDAPTRDRREQWFRKFLAAFPDPVLDDVLNFHATAGEGDPHDAIRMDRPGDLSTVSITSVVLGAGFAQMVYLAAPVFSRSVHQIPIEPTTAAP